MVDNVLKYRSSNLIILYHYTCSGLSGIIRVVIQNSMELIRNTGSGPQVDRWLEWSVISTGRVWKEY